MKLGRRAIVPWAIGGVLILCLWCSFLSGLGGWIMGQDLARREEQARFATAEVLRQERMPLGVVVTRLDRDGPAAAAGVQIGDLLVAVNGTSVQSARDLRDLMLSYHPGELVRLTVLREREHDVSVRLQPFPTDTRRPYLGIYYTARGDEPADL